MTEPLLLPWMQWDPDRHLLTVETSKGSRRLPALIEQGFHSTGWQIWMENGAGLDIEVQTASPPWSGSMAFPCGDGWLICTVYLTVRQRSVMHDPPDEDLPVDWSPARIVQGSIVPVGHGPRSDSWSCEIEDPDELVMYVDRWGKLPVVGLDRGFTQGDDQWT